MDLKDRFEIATSRGPQHRPVEERLTSGRSARRRRTTGLAALGTAAVLAASPVAMAVLDVHDPATTVAPANPNPTPQQEDGYEWADGELARMTMQGNVQVRPGATVNDRITSDAGERDSVALDLTWQGQRVYVLLYRTASGFYTAQHSAAPQSALGVWAAEALPEGELPVALHNGEGGGSDLPLVGYDNHELYTVDGAEIVRVIENPLDGWCEFAGHSTAAVEVRYQGTTYYSILGDGNCGGTFGPKGNRETLSDAVSMFASVLPTR